MPALILRAAPWVVGLGAGVFFGDRANDELRQLAITAAIGAGAYYVIKRA